jgi:hypothetical protein
MPENTESKAVEQTETKAPGQATVPEATQSDSTDTSNAPVSAAAFRRAMARVTGEKWELKRQVEELQKQLQSSRPGATNPTPETARGKSAEDTEFDQLVRLGGTSDEASSNDESVDKTVQELRTRVQQLEYETRLQRAANELQRLSELYPEVNPQTVIDAIARDGKDESFLEMYFKAERGNLADQIAAERIAREAEEQHQVNAGSTEGASKAATVDAQDYIHDPDPKHAMETYRALRDKGKIPRG